MRAAGDADRRLRLVSETLRDAGDGGDGRRCRRPCGSLGGSPTAWATARRGVPRAVRAPARHRPRDYRCTFCRAATTAADYCPGFDAGLGSRSRRPPGAQPGLAGGLWLWMILVLSLFQAVVVPSGFRTTVQPHW